MCVEMNNICTEIMELKRTIFVLEKFRFAYLNE